MLKKKARSPKTHTQSLGDAFDVVAKTTEGSILVVEAKNIGKRVTELRELAHSTIMDMTRTTSWYRKRFNQLMGERQRANKATVQNPFKLFEAAKPVLREIAVNGGDEFVNAKTILQFTWSSQSTLTDTMDLILSK